MALFGSTRFKHVSGKYDKIGFLKTTNLSLSDAGANLGTLKRGKLVDFADNSEVEMKLGGVGGAMGFLENNITLDGTTDLQGFKDLTIGKQDLPRKKGEAVSILVPMPGSVWEVEGLGAGPIDVLLITSGTGAISAATPIGTMLGVVSGAFRIAQVNASPAASDVVVARIVSANLTPENAGEVRLRIEWLGKSLRGATV